MSDLDSPFLWLGGAPGVSALVERFYDAMETLEPELAALHPTDEAGKISRISRDRFALFLIGWFGGPQDYTAKHGHPRLRMRHAHVPVNARNRAAWLHAMTVALDGATLAPHARHYLDARFAEVAEFLRNVEED